MKEFCLESGEGATNSQVEFLASINRQRLVLIRLHEIVHREFDVFVGDGREAGAISDGGRANVLDGARNAVHDLEADVFAFFIAIQPEHENVTTTGFRSKERGHLQLRRCFLLLGWCAKQLGWIASIPRVKFAGEIKPIDVTTNTRKFEPSRLIPKRSAPLVNRASTVEA